MITRDNYEEFFLLYTDNELSAAERHAVERFVADHPDLREEWEALLQCRLSPDAHLSFPDRHSLFKPEVEGSPYTGDLLSYIDRELNASATERIETILREQPLVARELATLRQTVSQPDPAIVFPDKASLFQPEKDRRVVLLFWLRTGIAAAVLAALALLWLLPTKQSHQPASSKPAQSLATQQSSPVAPKKIAPAVTSAPSTALHITEGSPRSKNERPVKRVTEKQKPQPPQDIAVNRDPDEQPAATLRPVGPVTTTTATRTSPDVAIGSVAPAGDLAADAHFAVQTGAPKEQSSFATQALQEEEVNDRPKLRGLFRKVTRAFGKTADRDNDGNRQVLVGAFQVSLN